ncbi:hypothetical protein BV22DRAFT_1060993 [Leucogyrophana mollusca]|uniref:Uncharacterized protein n=1 Tax=Leucogyrophana mollusca TaxID=85980 RepID=A0ACB8BQF0_9AGAM|nr:hypothetical protein BV22DRAFT_1060993 [Leucogyrophana mollusca]
MSKVSFTVRRPTPVSRLASAAGTPLAGSPRTFSSRDESDDDGETGIIFQNGAAEGDDDDDSGHSSDEELVSGFDKVSVQRCNKPEQPQGPLVIPAQSNPDWREAARRRRQLKLYAPESARASTGKDGSVGGLGTRDAINSGPQLSGLHKRMKLEGDGEDVKMSPPPTPPAAPKDEAETETDDQKALRALLAGDDVPLADIAPIPAPTEDDAYLQDVGALPDLPTPDDYARVPIAQFGAAMLRGMGWVEGTVASNSERKGLIEPYLPVARPALLGIGAKEREAEDDGSTKKERERRKRREDAKRYVPVVKREGEGGAGGSGSRREREGGSGSGSRRESESRDASARGSRDVSARGSRDRGDYDRDGREKNKRRDYDDRDKRRDYGDRDRDRRRDYDDRGKGREYDDRDRRRETSDRDRDRDGDRPSRRDR